MKNTIILIVDDHPLVRKSLCRFLLQELNNVCLYEADSGKKALEIAESFTPDLVLLDLNMPGMSGFETCDGMFKLGKNIPIIMLSFNDENALAEKALDAGAIAYLDKNAPREVILSMVKTNL